MNTINVNPSPAGTITLTGPPSNSTIYTAPTGTTVTPGSITIGSITSGSTGASSIWETDPFSTSITIGEHEINESTIGDLLVLLQVVKELDDDNPIKDMFNTIKMLNKIKGKK
jgi:hypothetical protein